MGHRCRSAVELRNRNTKKFGSTVSALLCIALVAMEVVMFVNPMTLPFLIYQRWLEIVFMPFLADVEHASKAAFIAVRACNPK
jgi:hypothetical protein